MKRLVLFFVALLCFAAPVLAQDVPLLQGKPFSHVTDTSVGVNWVSRIPIGDRDAVKFVIENFTAKKLLLVIWTATTTQRRPDLTDSGLTPATTYSYRMRAFFTTGGKSDSTNWVDLGTVQTAGQTSAVEQTAAVPVEYMLGQNYPNPFNPETTIKYQLAGRSEVSLKVYNLLGQEVATLVNTVQEPGVYRVQWNGINRLGQKVATGVYLFQLKAGDFTMTRKMVMMK